MSDWKIVEQYVQNYVDKNNYEPDTNIENIITVILLMWEGENEESEEKWSLSDYLHDVVGNDIQSYDYE